MVLKAERESFCHHWTRGEIVNVIERAGGLVAYEDWFQVIVLPVQAFGNPTQKRKKHVM